MDYEDYAAKAGVYDRTRVPVGVDTVLEQLERAGPLPGLTVLDAGCGTGNYLHALWRRVGRAVGVDASAEMLAQARTKLGPEVELVVSSITELPMPDASFDAVLSTQVLHHLPQAPADPPQRFTGVAAFFAEAARVLRPGGRIVLNASSHAQLRDGFWWGTLIPEAMARLAALCPDAPVIEALLRAHGFVVDAMVPDLVGVLQGDAYADPQGPLDPAWREGESTWTLATDGEVEAALARIRSLRERGELEAFVAASDRLRPRVGQSTFVVGLRA